MTPESHSFQVSCSDSLLAGVLESAMDAIITVDEQQKIVLFNRAAEAMFGWSLEAVLQQPLEWLIPARFHLGHALQMKQFGAAGTTSHGMGMPKIIRGQRANGEEFPIDVSISQVQTPAGRLFTAVVRDITEAERLKQVQADNYARLALSAAENARLLQEVSQLNAELAQKVAERTLALERQEALFHALVDQAPQVIWMLDTNGEVTYLNQAWFDLVGGALQDWTGVQWFAVIHPEDWAGIKANWLCARENQQPFSGLRRILCRDGSVHHMDYRASPVRDARGVVSFWVGVDADVTEIKAIEAALRQSNHELEAFSYSVSHDLRSPLGTINGFCTLLARQLTNDQRERVRYYLSHIERSVAQMGRLIEDLLSLAQVTRTTLHSESVDLSKMARQILKGCQAREPARDVRVEVEHALRVDGDARLLGIVMENLLGNAWKFSAHQTPAVISVGHQVDGAGLPVFFVRDNGAGFDMAYAEKLFVPFERLHAASEFAGTGIGLATVKRVIGRHGGQLWAESVPGQGATFFFTLPRPVAAV